MKPSLECASFPKKNSKCQSIVELIVVNIIELTCFYHFQGLFMSTKLL